MSKETGGPAFPYSWWDEQTGANAIAKGMTLRDYFAAKAMSLVMPDAIKELQRGYLSQEKTDKLKTAACEACYGIADAMLKAREQ